MKIFGIFISVVLGLGLITVFMHYTNERDKKLMDWAIKYEECVEREYKTTPTQYRLEHGDYPECNINKNELK